MKKLLGLLAMLVLAQPVLAADYCNIGLSPFISGSISNVVNYTGIYQNGTNMTINTSTVVGINYNFTRINASYYNYTDNFSSMLLWFNCTSQNDFFIINSTTSGLNISPNSTFNFSFIISPIRMNANYIINSWGVLGSSTSNISNLNQPYYYNYSATFPLVTNGQYRQQFEISDGLQFVYYDFVFNNTNYPVPIVLNVSYPTNLIVGKDYAVTVFALNAKNVTVYFDDNVFPLTNNSQYFYEGKVHANHFVSSIKIVTANDVYSVIQNNTITVFTPNIVANDVILPAVAVNQTSQFLLVDFGIDNQVPVTIEIARQNPNNQSDINTAYAFYIANEVGQINPVMAKKLYVYINPTYNLQGLVYVVVDSIAFNQRIIVAFTGTTYTNQPHMNITYYDKFTQCDVVGIWPNSTYQCSFSLPLDMNINNLQTNEIAVLKQGYERQLAAELSATQGAEWQRNVLILFAIILFIAFIIYEYRERVVILLKAR